VEFNPDEAMQRINESIEDVHKSVLGLESARQEDVQQSL